jgi:hypothetical protein
MRERERELIMNEINGEKREREYEKGAIQYQIIERCGHFFHEKFTCKEMKRSGEFLFHLSGGYR